MNIPYLLFGRAIKRGLASGDIRPKGLEGMAHCFCDRDGRAYWTWPDGMAMPLVRLKEVEALLIMAEAGMPEGTARKVADTIMEKAAKIPGASPKEKDKLAAEVGILTRELAMRRKDIIPMDALLALASVCSVREDEDPRGIDRDIHAQKIATFAKAVEAGDAFFLNSQRLQLLLGSAITSADGFALLRIGWKMKAERLNALLKACT